MNSTPESPYKGKYNYVVYVSTDMVGSRSEKQISVLDDHTEEEWDSLSQEEQDQYLDDVGRDVMWTMIEWGVKPTAENG